MTCIICGAPRVDTCLWCADPACQAEVLAMPTETLNAIRERECLDAWRQHPMPADGRGVYIHLKEK